VKIQTGILLTLILGLLSAAAPGRADPALPGLTYAPEGDAFVIHNGPRWYNRPLYCDRRQMVVEAGEMPGLCWPVGRLGVGIERGAVRLACNEFAQRTMRYRPGRMEWELGDARLPGLSVTMAAVTVASGDGFVVRVSATGAAVGDRLLWMVGPPDPKRPGASTKPIPGMQVTADGFASGVLLSQVDSSLLGSYTFPVSAIEKLSDAMAAAREARVAEAGVGLAVAVDLAKLPEHHLLVVTDKKFLPAGTLAQAFDLGSARQVALAQQVVVDTPDSYFNLGVSASCIAMHGLFVDTAFVHSGAPRWRTPYLGWRVMDGATAYGFHDLVGISARTHISHQTTKPTGKIKAEANEDGGEQSHNSRFYGLGKINSVGGRYDMQTQFFDQCCREWRSTGDRELEKILLPALELHLQWAKECFDPDDDGLYESYVNTWATDSQWYNGGGTVEESAYLYFQNRVAADLCRRAGRAEDARKHDAEAQKIQAALDRVLWLPGKGQYGAYLEQGGHRRVHDDAWILSEHLPIEAGLSTPMQAWQAMYYTDWAMEHFPLPYGGQMRQSSNWVPGTWSLRELYHGDNYGMALGYFLCGQGDEGWELLRGPMLESMYGDPTPKHGCGKGAGNANTLSPGSLGQSTCAIDFNDIASMFCRATVEGLFGYRPDYPNGVVAFTPAWPEAWDHAAIKTPDFSLAFKRDGAVDRYTIGLQRQAGLRLRVPIRAAQVQEVRVDGRPVEWKIEPWTGCGMMSIALPATTNAVVEVTLESRQKSPSPITIEKTVGQAQDILNAIDPQACLAAGAAPGFHMAFARVDRGNVPFLQVYKVNITDREGDARRAAQQLQQAPPAASWTPVAMEEAFNGDVRTIFHQRYAAPRPETVSARLAYDGWRCWIQTIQKGGKPLDVALDKLSTLRASDGGLLTPQHAVFAPVATNPGRKNIAFTSLWDNWPHRVTVPVNRSGAAVWLLVCGSTNPMQGRIANAVLTFRYADGREEKLELVPPMNFWSLCKFASAEYSYERDGFSLPKTPPAQVQLGTNCRAMVYGWKLRPGVKLESVALETLSQEVVIGLMGVSIMNPME